MRRQRFRLLGALLAPVFLIGAALACTRPSPDVLRVATFNIAHGRGLAVTQIGLPRDCFEANLAQIAHVLRRESPDVVALQEADGPSAWSGRFSHVAWLADAADYPHRFHGLHVDTNRLGLPLRYGTALLARRPLFNTRSHAFDLDVLDTKGYVVAETRLGGRPLLVASVHLDFKSPANRRAQASLLIDDIRKRALPTIVLGDFNCTWKAEEDALRLIAARLDLHPFEPDVADRDTFPADNPCARLDWILVSPSLKFVAYRRWLDQLSDHLAVFAGVTWR